MRDAIGTQFLNDAEQCRLVRHTYGDARWGDVKILGMRQATSHLKGCVVGLNKLLFNGDVLPYEDVKVGVLLLYLVL